MAIKHGKLFVISGPSGVGKGALIEQLLAQEAGFTLSISYTSRSPRNGEKNGREYYFVSKTKFLEMVKKNAFIEYAEVHGNYYGTSREKLQKILQTGQNVIFEVDIQGGLALKKQMPEIVTLFILPPSEEELIRRIEKRGSETKETLQRRLVTMRQEMLVAEKYDYQVVNADLVQAVAEIKSIFAKNK